MRKFIALSLAALTLGLSAMPAAQAAPAPGRGGIVSFFVGCCFGLRTGAAYNEGKDIHFREWCLLIPYVGVVFAIWNGIDGANGVTRADLNTKYPGNFY
jgi:hypothetical protein